MSLRGCAVAALAAVAAVLLAGCARVPLGPPAATMDTIVAARASGIAPVGLGEFRLAPGRPAALDLSVGARGNTFLPPSGQTFSQYLKDTLAAQLRAAGLLQAGAPVLVEGWLTETALDVPAGSARAVLAARFVVRRDGRVAYERELRVEDHWTASLLGVDALPDALNRYTTLYRQLAMRLLADPAFQAAARGVIPSTAARPEMRTAAHTS